MKDDNETMKDVIQYLNFLVTTINSGLGIPVLDRYPCYKHFDELKYDLQDYIELINKLQCHTWCNSSYCLRIDRTGHQYCRFGYPKDPTEDTYLRDDNGQPKLITARNDPLINPHDRLQLQG